MGGIGGVETSETEKMITQKVTREQAREASRQRIAEIRAAGIRFVMVVGSWSEADNCDACRSMRGRVIDTELAPELPLRGCRKKFCGCGIVAYEGV
jgi:hypothetical protein